EAVELDEPDGCVQVGQHVPEADLAGSILPATGGAPSPGVVRNAQVAERAQPLDERVVVGGDGAALAAGHVLDRIEAEAGRVPERSNRPPIGARAERVGAVVDGEQVVPAS